MRKLLLAVLLSLLTAGLWAQSTPPATDDAAQLRQEIDQLKKTMNGLEQRLDAQEKDAQQKAAQPAAPKVEAASTADLQTSVRDLNDRVLDTERKGLRDRLEWGGDYRFEAHTIMGNVPAHYDGMQLQNLTVKTLWLFAPTTQGGLGITFNPNMLQQMTPDQFAGFVNQQQQQNYSQYQFFTNNLTFGGLKQAIGQFSPQMQQMLIGYLQQVTGNVQSVRRWHRSASLQRST